MPPSAPVLSIPAAKRAQTLYLWAALAALPVVLLAAALFYRHAEKQIEAHTAALAALNIADCSRGVALQHRIARQPDTLLVYGSSELSNFEPTRADLFFRAHPEAGFKACVIGQPGDRCLFILQELAALGESIHGRKVVIFLSPNWFVAPEEALASRRQRQFEANFSPVQTSLFLLNERVQPSLKKQIALRLLDRQGAIAEISPILARELADYRAPKPLQTALSWLSRPLLLVQAGVFRWQDCCHTAQLASSSASLFDPACSPSGPLDWTGLNRDVESTLMQRGISTPFSLDLPGTPPPAFLTEASPLRLYPKSDQEFLQRLSDSREWTDLDLLLQTIRRLRAHVLLVSQPFNGTFYDSLHVSTQARMAYYERVRALADGRGIALSDFSAFEGDRSFFADLLHPSAKAWLSYDRTMMRFYLEKDHSAHPIWAKKARPLG